MVSPGWLLVLLFNLRHASALSLSFVNTTVTVGQDIALTWKFEADERSPLNFTMGLKRHGDDTPNDVTNQTVFTNGTKGSTGIVQFNNTAALVPGWYHAEARSIPGNVSLAKTSNDLELKEATSSAGTSSSGGSDTSAPASTPSSAQGVTSNGNTSMPTSNCLDDQCTTTTSSFQTSAATTGIQTTGSFPDATLASPTETTTANRAPTTHNQTARIVGAVIGSVVGLSLIALCVFLLIRRKRSKQSDVALFYPHLMVTQAGDESKLVRKDSGPVVRRMSAWNHGSGSQGSVEDDDPTRPSEDEKSNNHLA